jgi:hypothetical protein
MNVTRTNILAVMERRRPCSAVALLARRKEKVDKVGCGIKRPSLGR